MKQLSLEDEINRYARLSEIILAVSSSEDLETALSTSVEKIYTILKFDYCWLALVNKDTKNYNIQQLFNIKEKVAESISGVPLKNGICGWIIENQQMYLSGNWEPTQKEIIVSKLNNSSIMALPLQVSGETIGAIAFVTEQENYFEIVDLEIAVTFTVHMALAIDRWSQVAKLVNVNKKLEERVLERTKALQVTNQTLKQKNEELLEKQKEVEEANRLKSEFLANMSHELRTPMNIIIGYTNIVINKTRDILPPRQLSNLTKVHNNANVLLGLINDILDISKIESGKMDIYPTFFNVKEVVEDCLHSIKVLIKDKPVSTKLIIDKIPNFYSDKEKFKQILTNLLSNSVKFTRKGEIKIEVYLKEKTLVCICQDTGIGISKEAQKYIFDKFRQADASTTKNYGGTGLGLAIVKTLVELLSGTIELESEEGKGTVFTLKFPWTDSE